MPPPAPLSSSAPAEKAAPADTIVNPTTGEQAWQVRLEGEPPTTAKPATLGRHKTWYAPSKGGWLHGGDGWYLKIFSVAFDLSEEQAAVAELAVATVAAEACGYLYNFTTTTDANGAYTLTMPYPIDMHEATPRAGASFPCDLVAQSCGFASRRSSAGTRSRT